MKIQFKKASDPKSYPPHLKYSVATGGWWPPYWTIQIENILIVAESSWERCYCRDTDMHKTQNMPPRSYILPSLGDLNPWGQRGRISPFFLILHPVPNHHVCPTRNTTTTWTWKRNTKRQRLGKFPSFFNPDFVISSCLCCSALSSDSVRPLRAPVVEGDPSANAGL